MKVTINKLELVDCLKTITPFISEKGIQNEPLVVNISNNQICFSYYNDFLGVGIWSTITKDYQLDKDTTLEKLLEAETFTKIIPSFPGDTLFLNFSESKIQISDSNATQKVALKYIDGAAHPPLEYAEITPIKINSTIFKQALNYSAPFVSKDITRPTMMMVKLKFAEDKLNYYSTDGQAQIIYGHESINYPNSIEQSNIYIPGNIAERLVKICPNNVDISLSTFKNFIITKFDNLVLKILPYIGEFDSQVEKYTLWESTPSFKINVGIFLQAIGILSVLSQNYVESAYKTLIQISQSKNNVIIGLINNTDTSFTIGATISDFSPVIFRYELMKNFVSQFPNDAEISVGKLSNSNLPYPPYKFHSLDKNFSMLLMETRL